VLRRPGYVEANVVFATDHDGAQTIKLHPVKKGRAGSASRPSSGSPDGMLDPFHKGTP